MSSFAKKARWVVLAASCGGLMCTDSPGPVQVEDPPEADVQVTKSGPSSVGAGSDFTYTITVTNHGPDAATQVVVRDALPGAVAFVSASNGGAASGGTVTWPAVSLDDGESVQRTVTVTAPASGTLENVARATAATSDPNAGNNDGSNTAAHVVTTVTPVQPPGYVVNTVNDVDDGTCNATHCSMREAIEAANAHAGADDINFSISGTPPHVIVLGSELPAITESVTIDGTSDPDAVVLQGSSAGPSANGLRVTGGSATIRGLVILNFAGGAGIRLGTSGNKVLGNIIGLEFTGTTAYPNGVGIRVDAGTGNTIGGSKPADRNLISGNSGDGILLTGTSSQTTIRGNYVGLNAGGNAALGNGGQGVHIVGVPDNSVGGSGTGEGNAIGGNAEDGVLITGAGARANRVEGNIVGVDAAASGTRVANGRSGVHVGGGAGGNDIGGSAAGAGNIIAANHENGVRLDGAAASNRVRGNVMGSADGLTHAGNARQAVYIEGSGNAVGGTGTGAGNLIIFNGEDGVAVVSGTGNSILGNSIYQNQAVANPNGTGLGIDLGDDDVTLNDAGDGDGGPNGRQNFPELTSALQGGTITGTLNSLGGKKYRIEFFANTKVDPEDFVCDRSGYGEGEAFLGAVDVTTGSGGNATFTTNFGALTTGDYVTATATDPAGSTSEFSACVQVQVTTSASRDLGARVPDRDGR